jgi:hypothetical protein
MLGPAPACHCAALRLLPRTARSPPAPPALPRLAGIISDSAAAEGDVLLLEPGGALSSMPTACVARKKGSKVSSGPAGSPCCARCAALHLCLPAL